MKIFVSSTYNDLKDTRARLIKHLEDAGVSPVRMEVFGARPETSLDTSLAELRGSDVVIVLIGSKYGSRIPGSDLSYSHREVREAIEYSIPVYAFVLTDQEPPNAQDAEATQRLRDEVGAYVTYAETTERDAPAEVLAAIVRHIREHGAAGRAHVFQEPEAYFHPLMKEESPFNLTHALVGREGELDRIVGHARSGEGAMLLTAPGGVGKTRLLLELATRLEDHRDLSIRFVALDARWHPASLVELPSGSVCIVVDDGHRREDLPELVAGCVQRQGRTCFIVTCRPGAVEQIRYFLRHLPRGAESEATIELEPLGRDQAVQLANNVLGKRFSHLAERLARVAGGNPLVITVGGRSIVRKRIAPEVLEGADEAFRRAALDRLLVDVGDFEAGGLPVRDCLDLVAAVGPIRTDNDSFREAACRYLGVTRPQWVGTLSQLERWGLLLRRGRTLRVSPDVLGDHIVFRAAVTVAGEHTGFFEDIIERFGVEGFENLLANASELEWRERALDRPVRVSDALWTRLRADLERRSHRCRAALIPVLRRPALFNPERTLEEIRWLTAAIEAPRDEVAEQYDLPNDHELVLAALVGLVGQIARHRRQTRACVLWLCERAIEDQRPTGPNPEHPVRQLGELVGYTWGQPLEIQQAALDEVCRFAVQPGRLHRLGWLAAVLGKALDKQGEYRRATATGLTLGAYPLHDQIERIRPLREAALRAVEDLAVGDDPVEANAAVRVLFGTLHPPVPLLGREIQDEEREAWLPEARRACELIAGVARRTTSDGIRAVIRRTAEEWRADWWPSLGPAVRQMLEELPALPNQELLDVLQGQRWGRPDFKAEERQLQELATRVAAHLWQRSTEVSEVIDQIRRAIESLESIKPGEVEVPGGWRLFRALAQQRPERAADLALNVIERNVEALAEAAPAIFGAIDLHERRATDHRVLEAAASARSQRIRFRFACSLRSLFHGREISEDDLAMVRLFLQDEDPWTRVHALDGLRYVGEQLTDQAVQLFLTCDITDEPRCADCAIDIFGNRGFGIPFERLTDDQVDAILDRIEPVRRLSAETHNIISFIQWACTRRPRHVVEMLLARIERAGTEPESREDSFDPLPFSVEHVSLLPAIAQAAEYEELLGMVADAARLDDWRSMFWIPNLIRMIAEFDGVARIVRRAIDARDPSRIQVAAGLLKSYDHEMVFDRHELMAELLTAAWEVGAETYSRVSSSLFGLAISGVVSGSPGQPAPRLVSDKERSEVLVQQYDDDEPVRCFYESVRDHAKEAMKRNLEEWEEVAEGDWSG